MKKISDNNRQSSSASNATDGGSRNHSSFKRKESAGLSVAERLPEGVKRWSVGSSFGLISSGHAQLDKLIGGGFALGSICLQEIDSYSDYGRTLLYYNICESLSNGNKTVIILFNRKEGDLLLSKLPLNISKSAEDFDADRTSYCYSYDLSKSVQQEIVTSSSIEWVYIDEITAAYHDGNATLLVEHILERIFQKVSTVLDSNSSNAIVSRVFIPCMYEILTASEMLPHEMTIQSRLVAQFVLRMKHRIRSSNAFLHLCITPALLLSCPGLSTKLCHICDTVLAVQSFAGRAHTIPHEFSEFSGFLLVLKTQDSGMFAAFRPSSSRFGLKRDRRKLHIEPLHLPPEQNRAFVGTGGFDSIPTPPTSTSTSTSTNPSGNEHSHGVEIHYHHPRGVQPDLPRHSSPASKAESRSIDSSVGPTSPSNSNNSSDASNQSKLSSSLAAIKVAARDPAAVANFLTSPTLLPLPVPISIAAARSKTSSGSSSTSKGNSNNKNIEF